MRLEVYLEELLYRHECVIIPGFGGFVSNFAPARINPSTHVFTPPSRILTFNKNLRNNDGLLANHIAGQEGLSFMHALDKLREFVNLAQARLDAGEPFQIQGLGKILADKEGKLNFIPEEGHTFLPSSFGLQPFRFPPIKREELAKKIEKQFKDRVAPEVEVKGVKKRRVRPARVIAMAASFLFLAALVYIPWQTTLMEQHGLADLNPFKSLKPYTYSERQVSPELSPEPLKMEREWIYSESDLYSSLRVTDEGPERIVLLKKNPADPDNTQVKNHSKDIASQGHGRYHLIAGAFAVPENATNYVSKLRGEGLNAGILDQQFSALRYVSVGSYPTREEALAALTAMKSARPEIWVLVK